MYHFWRQLNVVVTDREKHERDIKIIKRWLIPVSDPFHLVPYQIRFLVEIVQQFAQSRAINDKTLSH